jgi:diguanylate cyclase (GGDEF)-like protein
MVDRAAPGLRAVLLIALPLILAGAGMMWSTARMLDGISQSVNAQEHARAWEAVNSAFDSALEHLAGVMADNAHWDDAVVNAGVRQNHDWIDTMWGVTTVDENYDVMFVVAPDGTTLSAYRKGIEGAVVANSYLGPALPKLLADLPEDPAEFAVKTSLVATPDGVVAVAAGPMVPNTDQVEPMSGRPTALILGHLITGEDLIKMSNHFIVDDLRLVAGKNEGGGGSVLKDAWGAPVATVTWTDRHPGVAARQSYSTSAVAILLALIGVMVPVSVAHFRAMQKLARGEQQARQDARRDALTGLPNRLALSERLAVAMSMDTALLYIDLDGFKSINDTYDHATGDRLLKAVAAGISSLLKGNATLARLGGDEFAVLLEDGALRAGAETLARQILELVAEPFNIDGRVASVGASIGIAMSEGGRLEPAELMRQADVAMYDSKANGRGQFRWYMSSMDGKRLEGAETAAEIRDFIARRHFEVAYQPIVDSSTRHIIGVEALARWPKSSQRRLAPDVFIPIAEEHGLIDELGALILEIACHDVAQWQDIHLSVNVSPVQLNNPDFISRLRHTVTRAGFDLTRLEVEFTESVLIRNTQRAKEVIADLHQLGVSVALDDFGTGFASVGYLRAFHFDKIKLDRSLTHSILTNIQAQKVVQGTVLIASGLSAEIIAEGVETEEEAQLMRLSGCHQLQGYHFGRPRPAEELGSMLPGNERQLRAIA